MTIAERNKLLQDAWPEVDAKKRKAMLKAIKVASKARIFEYVEDSEEISIKQ